MNIRPPETPFPPYEPAAGYFAPPPSVVTGQEWRLIQPLRDSAQSKNATTILTDAVVAQCQQHLTPSAQNLGMAFAELAVTGRAAFADFASTLPQMSGPIQAAALAKLTTLGIPGITAKLLQTAMSEVLDRAYQVAWFLRAQTSRGNLKWITVSGEDDLPHRPVNVPSSLFPQCDLFFTVPGDLGAIAVQTRYIIASAANPVVTPVALPQRSLPASFEPVLPASDRIILFIHGSDSRLEEASDLIPKLVSTPDGRPTGFTVIAMDLPGSGYVNQIDHTEVGPWTPATIPTPWPLPPVGLGSVKISLLPFLENFLVAFVGALSSRLGQPGLVESQFAGVMGGSLGGNLALRLARRPEKWLKNAIAYSPGSVWRTAGPLSLPDPVAVGDAVLLQAGVMLGIPSVGEPESVSSRDQFFASAFDQKIPAKTQPEQWYRDGWPSKMQYITNARLDRREIYTLQYRRWHWRVSLEELLWSWQDPAVQNFRARVLLGAGAYDDILPAHIYSNARKLAGQLPGTGGDTFFFEDTGHSIHAERPDALARRVIAFLTGAPIWNWLDLGKPPSANLRGLLGAVTIMDTPASPQRPHVFVEGNDYNLWCCWSNGSTLSWLNMGKPPGANIIGSVGAVSVMDAPGAPQRPHLFVAGNDGNLWLRSSSGPNWTWQNKGKPPTAAMRGLLGAVTVMDTTSSPQRPHVFVEGNDYNLWCCWSNGSIMSWLNMGKPPGANITGLVGLVTVMDTTSSPQRPHLFVTGSDGNMWIRSPGAGDIWTWQNLGRPPGVNLRGRLGATTVMDTSNSPQRPHAFVEGDDYNLWCLWSNGSTMSWLNMGKPPGVNITGSVGAVSVMDTPNSPQRAHLFVTGNDGNLWLRVSSGADWSWQNLGKPPTANLNSPIGAVTVMDTPASAQRPHAFVEGSDGHLWVDFWG